VDCVVLFDESAVVLIERSARCARKGGLCARRHRRADQVEPGGRIVRVAARTGASTTALLARCAEACVNDPR